jgi:hypothetical protein
MWIDIRRIKLFVIRWIPTPLTLNIVQTGPACFPYLHSHILPPVNPVKAGLHGASKEARQVNEYLALSCLLRVDINLPKFWGNASNKEVNWQVIKQGKWINTSSISQAACLPPPPPAGNLPFTCLLWTPTCLLASVATTCSNKLSVLVFTNSVWFWICNFTFVL